jgi:flavin prenyltransferase
MSDETPPGRRSIAVAVTGASGALYAARTMAALLERGCHLELIVSEYGRRLLRDELGDDAAVDKLREYLAATYGDAVRTGTYTLHRNKDLGAKLASGSQDCEAMVVVPCSMKTLAGIAHGLSRNLVERAADVMLKEHRTLIIVPRETPMSLPQLRNMVVCAEHARRSRGLHGRQDPLSSRVSTSALSLMGRTGLIEPPGRRRRRSTRKKPLPRSHEARGERIDCVLREPRGSVVNAFSVSSISSASSRRKSRWT